MPKVPPRVEHGVVYILVELIECACLVARLVGIFHAEMHAVWLTEFPSATVGDRIPEKKGIPARPVVTRIVTVLFQDFPDLLAVHRDN